MDFEGRKRLFLITVLSGVVFVGLANNVLSHMEYTVTERLFYITLLHGGICGALFSHELLSKSTDVQDFLLALQFLLTAPVYMIVRRIWGFQHTGFALGLFYGLIFQALRPILSKLLYKCYHWARQVPRRVSRLFLRQDGGILLRLPPELRLEVYSHLMPSNQPLSVSRALRQTCRQINHEVEHEQRKDFERQIKVLKLTEDHKGHTLSYNSDIYHVDISISAAGSCSPTEWKDYCTALTSGAHVLRSGGYATPLYRLLSLNTRSITITLDIPAEITSKVLDIMFQYYLDRTREHFESTPIATKVRAGESQLYGFMLQYKRPVVMVPVFHYGWFTWEPRWIKFAGQFGRYEKVVPRRLCYGHFLRRDQRFLLFKRTVLMLLPLEERVEYKFMYE